MRGKSNRDAPFHGCQSSSCRRLLLSMLTYRAAARNTRVVSRVRRDTLCLQNHKDINARPVATKFRRVTRRRGRLPAADVVARLHARLIRGKLWQSEHGRGATRAGVSESPTERLIQRQPSESTAQNPLRVRDTLAAQSRCGCSSGLLRIALPGPPGRKSDHRDGPAVSDCGAARHASREDLLILGASHCGPATGLRMWVRTRSLADAESRMARLEPRSRSCLKAMSIVRRRTGSCEMHSRGRQ